MRPTSSSTGERCMAAAGVMARIMRPGSPTGYARGLLEAVAEGQPDHPRTQRRLLDDELIGADEEARIRVAQILDIQVHVPAVLGDTAGRVVDRVRGVLEPAARVRDGFAESEGGIGTGLREGVAAVGGTELHEWCVAVHVPLIAQARAELQRR